MLFLYLFLKILYVHQAQLQDAKRRWEELQSYLHSVNTEREKLQAAKQGTVVWCCYALPIYAYTCMINIFPSQSCRVSYLR